MTDFRQLRSHKAKNEIDADPIRQSAAAAGGQTLVSALPAPRVRQGSRAGVAGSPREPSPKR